jgi:altronate dehydratase
MEFPPPSANSGYPACEPVAVAELLRAASSTAVPPTFVRLKYQDFAGAAVVAEVDSQTRTILKAHVNHASPVGKTAGAWGIGCKEFETLGDLMATTFRKRQKEMKMQEKQRETAERRKQKKLAESVNSVETTDAVVDFNEPSESHAEK